VFNVFSIGSKAETFNQQVEDAGLSHKAESREQIVTLLELSTINPKKAEYLLKKIKSQSSIFNNSEQYLLLLAQAKIRQNAEQHQDAVLLIEQAKLLRKGIAKKQLDLPLFYNAYLIQAISYAAINDYSNAYQNKQVYVDYYNNYSDENRKYTIDKLTKKHDVAHKKEINQLLSNQNMLKERHIADVQKKQHDQQNRIRLIIGTILLIIILFFWQLKVRRKLLYFVKTDSLTGILNRAALFSKGHKLMKNAREQHLELSILLVDIDHFKSINDQFGHSVGDLVLTKVAQLVNETMRSRDVFARLGGEEFIAILPSSDHGQAKAIAVRVLEKVSQNNFSDLGVECPITLSIGVANIKDTKTEFDDILHAADLAMYQAKAQGRNQMVSYESVAKDQERRQL
jgi:diguanylate cyclase (GGDEF)-like protein